MITYRVWRKLFSGLVRILLLAVFAMLVIPTQVLAGRLNCNTSCKSQCTTEAWWGGNSFDYTCYAACQIWQAPNCGNDFKNELRNNIWGEIGPYLYVAGGAIIAARNAQTHPVGIPLTPQQKLRLFDIFSHFLSTEDLSAEYAPFIPEFLSRVRIRWDAKMLDEFNMEELKKNLELSVFLKLQLLVYGNLITWTDFMGSGGQTFGLDVYINHPQGYLNEILETNLLAHELIHTLQYLKRGSSLHAFGKDYFRGPPASE